MVLEGGGRPAGRPAASDSVSPERPSRVSREVCCVPCSSVRAQYSNRRARAHTHTHAYIYTYCYTRRLRSDIRAYLHIYTHVATLRSRRSPDTCIHTPVRRGGTSAAKPRRRLSCGAPRVFARTKCHSSSSHTDSRRNRFLRRGIQDGYSRVSESVRATNFRNKQSSIFEVLDSVKLSSRLPVTRASRIFTRTSEIIRASRIVFHVLRHV